MRMQAEDPHVFVPQQFSNPGNLEAHRLHTAAEILEQVTAPSKASAPAWARGGTISAIGEALRARNPGMEIWAWSRKTRRSSQAGAWARTCRWASATA